MLRFHNYDVVFAEIPGETTLAINLTGCPNRCPGCHSPHLQADGGEVLDDEALRFLLGRYGPAVTCVCFMGGDGDPSEVARLAAAVRQAMPRLRVGWYSGRRELPAGVAPAVYDYIKLGPWVEALGPLSSPATNQRLYRVASDGTLTDITAAFRQRGRGL
ncbi:MAG: anaerobic ribonucleoside-triphosphate reductase activating protein [Alistipes sp.]|nr:anaerobic ribonucleoside-triphosphate reductase activating protein [Alistipes sp.]MDE7077553.1 anaerobic ribonucleoside-triphosphate reductase activating protein [Alistipes sp.]